MTHSQQPSIDILNKEIDKMDSSFYQEGVDILVKVLKEIQSLPQSPTVESLLEEMRCDLICLSDEWRAEE